MQWILVLINNAINLMNVLQTVFYVQKSPEKIIFSEFQSCNYMLK